MRSMAGTKMSCMSILQTQPPCSRKRHTGERGGDNTRCVQTSVQSLVPISAAGSAAVRPREGDAESLPGVLGGRAAHTAQDERGNSATQSKPSDRHLLASLSYEMSSQEWLGNRVRLNSSS